jgi:Bacteriophage Mu Gam like protein
MTLLVPDMPQFPDAPDPHAPTVEEVQTGAWIVDNQGKAIWASRQLSELQERIEAVEALAQNEIARLEAKIAKVRNWNEDAQREDRRRAAYFQGQLEEYALRVREETGDRQKHVLTPYVRVSTTASQPKVEVTDKSAFTDWALANQRLDLLHITTTTRTEPALVAIKAELHDGENGEVVDPLTGESVPGLRPIPARITARTEIFTEE